MTKNSIRADILAETKFVSGRDVLESIPWENMSDRMRAALKSLLAGQNALQQIAKKHLAKAKNAKNAPEMTFALDGRLVGDIGELIAAEVFNLELLGTSSTNIDARTTAGLERKVQIKATFQKDGLSIKYGRDSFIGLQLDEHGKFRVIYNGQASTVMQYLKAPASAGKQGRTNAGHKLEPLTLEAWAVLNLAVAARDRIPRRIN